MATITAYRPPLLPWSESAEATWAVPTGERPQTYEAGRVCSHRGCTTVLSIYNGGKLCSLHSSNFLRRVVRRQRAHRKVTYDDAGNRICTICGMALPPTTEYFHRRAGGTDGLKGECKVCSLERRSGRLMSAGPAESRVCPRCGTHSRLDAKHWRPNPKRLDGWARVCRECERKAWRERNQT